MKIFVVCPSVCDGCGRGHNEFAGRVQNYCISAFIEMSINFLEIVLKSCCRSGHCVAGYAKVAIVEACHRTSDEQEHLAC